MYWILLRLLHHHEGRQQGALPPGMAFQGNRRIRQFGPGMFAVWVGRTRTESEYQPRTFGLRRRVATARRPNWIILFRITRIKSEFYENKDTKIPEERWKVFRRNFDIKIFCLRNSVQPLIIISCWCVKNKVFPYNKV